MILTMTVLNDQFNGLVKVTLEKKQTLAEDTDDIQLEIMNKSAKTTTSFVIVSLVNQSESTLQLK